jgi:hypothetical protein
MTGPDVLFWAIWAGSAPVWWWEWPRVLWC